MDSRVTSIADKLIDRVVIKLGDGSEWPLLITFHVLLEFEKQTGLNALFNADKVFGEMSATNLLTLLYLCLREQGAKYTLEETGQLAYGRIAMLRGVLLIAFTKAMVQKDDAAIELIAGNAQGELKAAS